MKNFLQKLIHIFSPNRHISRTTLLGMVIAQCILLLGLWITASSPLLPSPMDIFSALGRLLEDGELVTALWASISLSIQATLITIIVSLLISYATVMPFFRPLAFLVSKGRFLTLVGLTFVFTMLTHNGHQLKLSLLVFGMSVFFVTGMVSVIRSIPAEEFKHARSLRMSEWRVVWEVVILARMDTVFELVRQNFAISWMMLTMVEGISRSEGGIGTLLLNQNKHLHLDAVFAIQFIILFVGIAQDYILGLLKLLFCPYANLTLEKN